MTEHDDYTTRKLDLNEWLDYQESNEEVAEIIEAQFRTIPIKIRLLMMEEYDKKNIDSLIAEIKEVWEEE